MRLLTSLITLCGLLLTLTGCSTGSPDLTKLTPPAARYMRTPAPMPDPPKGSMANPIYYQHEAELRGVCVGYKRTIRGLQSYARTITRKAK